MAKMPGRLTQAFQLLTLMCHGIRLDQLIGFRVAFRVGKAQQDGENLVAFPSPGGHREKWLLRRAVAGFARCKEVLSSHIH